MSHGSRLDSSRSWSRGSLWNSSRCFFQRGTRRMRATLSGSNQINWRDGDAAAAPVAIGGSGSYFGSASANAPETACIPMVSRFVPSPSAHRLSVAGVCTVAEGAAAKWAGGVTGGGRGASATGGGTGAVRGTTRANEEASFGALTSRARANAADGSCGGIRAAPGSRLRKWACSRLRLESLPRRRRLLRRTRRLRRHRRKRRLGVPRRRRRSPGRRAHRFPRRGMDSGCGAPGAAGFGPANGVGAAVAAAPAAGPRFIVPSSAGSTAGM